MVMVVVVVPRPPPSHFPLGADFFVLTYFFFCISISWVYFWFLFQFLIPTPGLFYVCLNCIPSPPHLSCRILLYTHALTFLCPTFILPDIYITP
jgi:hypothetical protein